jgi:predicted secreted hydrolase
VTLRSHEILRATLLVALCTSCHDQTSQPHASLSVAENLSGDESGYAKALAPREFHFPEDHGPHPDFRTEWWYFTGNLGTREGQRFGFQLTFFRSALAPRMPARASAWATRQAYLANFTVTDEAGKSFQAFERWGRGALGLAGAQASPFHVWTGDWSASAMTGGTFPLRLRAAQGDTAIDLVVQEGKPPVLQGDRGLSRKSAEPGNASYYYSLPRMPTSGSLRVNGRRFAVSGAAWMDREWSTSSLGRDQIGWDWFALQLDDGGEVMLYQLRQRDGTSDPASSGTTIAPHGEALRLPHGRFSITALDHWRSPRSGAVYPARWRLLVPGEGLDLEVTPLLADQELNLSFRYWEGAVAVRGTRHGRAVSGRGYAELTGYAEEAPR